MAEEKKPDKPGDKPAPAPAKDPFVEIIVYILIFVLLASFINSVIRSVNQSGIFSRGWKGLTYNSILLAHTRPIASLQNPIGVRAITTQDTTVYDAPGGKSVGTQKLGAKGKIVQGPVVVDGVRYWYVDYETGADGWVREGDIAYYEQDPTALEKFLLVVNRLYSTLLLVSLLITIILIVLIVYLCRQISLLAKNEHVRLYPIDESKVVAPVNPKWERIISHIESQNENDWRLAIMEADIMLDDLLDKLSLPGDTMGDKLKAVEKSDFQTIDNAWEAHKIRNQIAHEGSDFALTQREARRVIELYRTIFEEFQMI